MKLLVIATCMVLGFLYLPNGNSTSSWKQWVHELKNEAMAEGINPELLEDLFSTMSVPDKTVQHYNHHQPEHRITFVEYQNTRADNYKIIIGRKEYKIHQAILKDVASHFNVDSCFIVALWGMETSYGRFTGKFSVVKSLATLAYQSNRQAKFRKELFYALHMLNQNQISVEKFKGEWAGATGQPQFLPSSWFEYAVDYDHCGRKDIWTSYPDVFASIANYLNKNNWHDNEPVIIPVVLPHNFERELIGKNNVKTVDEWALLGVRTMDGKALPYPHLNASIIQPDEQSIFLIYPNFHVLLTYNNSIYYAGTVDFLAHNICSSLK